MALKGGFMSITIEKLQAQLQQLIHNRDSYAQAFQQTVGAINLIQEQMKMVLVEPKPPVADPVPEPKADEPLPQEPEQEPTAEQPEGEEPNAAQEGNE